MYSETVAREDNDELCERRFEMVMESEPFFNNICVSNTSTCFSKSNSSRFSCSGTYTIIQTYRNKCGIIEYVAAGVTSGVIYKFNMGPRGWVVGAGVGKLILCGSV